MRTVREIIHLSTQYLKDKGVASPRLDAEILLSHVLSFDRVTLYCSLDRPLQTDELNAYRELIRRRQNREPVAYIVGNKEFYGLDFHVTPHVLIPRPDTETLVEAALNWLKEKSGARVFDVGTGSGAIAIALAKLSENAQVIASDIDGQSLLVAIENGKTHGLSERIRFVEGAYFANEQGPFDLIVSNPPYIPDSDKDSLEPEITQFEPPGALFAGDDGLDIIRKLIDESIDRLAPDGALMIEIGQGQDESVLNLMQNAGVFDTIDTVNDLSGIARVARALRYHGDE